MKLKAPIDLCGADNCENSPSPLTLAPEGVYVRLPDIAELGSLPLCGEITFRYERKSVSLTGADELSASLVLQAITAVKADPTADDGDAPKDDMIDKLFGEATAEESDENEES